VKTPFPGKSSGPAAIELRQVMRHKQLRVNGRTLSKNGQVPPTADRIDDLRRGLVQ
jgi:hypothetical protein